MAVQDDWELFLDNLRAGSEQLLILAEDPESKLGWRLLTQGDVDTLRQILDHKASDSVTLPNKLCYNVEEAAQLVGVSVHKFKGWFEAERPPGPAHSGRQEDHHSGRYVGRVASGGGAQEHSCI